jgi:hypothetical protein
VEKYCRAGQATDDNMARMRIACWIPNATDTHLEYVILIAFSTATGVYGNAPQRFVTSTLACPLIRT